MKKLLAFSLLLLSVACAAYSRYEPLEVDYRALGKIYFDARDLRIVDGTKDTPQWDPYVGHLFHPTVTEAVNRLVADRFQMAGQMGHVTVTVKDATVTQQPIDPSSDLVTLFERQQASKYIGRVEVAVEAQSPGGTVAIATAYASRYVTLPEAATSNEKYEAYSKLLNGLMDDLNKQLEKAIRQHLAPFMLAQPGAPSALDVDGFATPSPTQDSAAGSWARP